MPVSIAAAAAGSGNFNAMLERLEPQDPQALVSQAEALFMQEGGNPLTEQEAQTLEQNIRELQDALPFSSLWRYEASDSTLPQYESSGYVALESILSPDGMADLEALSADMSATWEDLLSDPAVQETIAELQAGLEALNLGDVALELEAAEGNPEAEASIVETALRAVVPEADIEPLMASFRDVRDTLSDMALPAGILALLALILVWTQHQTLANRLPGVSKVLSDFRAYAGEYRFRYLLPDFFTAGNLLAALLNMALFPILYPIDPALAFEVAAGLLIAGALADMVDGGAARLVRSRPGRPAPLAEIYRRLGLTAWAEAVERDVISTESQRAVANVDDIGDGAGFGVNIGKMATTVGGSAMAAQGVPTWIGDPVALTIGIIYIIGALKRLIDFVKRDELKLSHSLGDFVGNSTTGNAGPALAAYYMIATHVPPSLVPACLLIVNLLSFKAMNDTEHLHPHLGRPLMRAMRILLTSPTSADARAELGPALRYLLLVPGGFFGSLGVAAYTLGPDGFFGTALLWAAAYLFLDQRAEPGNGIWNKIAQWDQTPEARRAAVEDLQTRERRAGLRPALPNASETGLSDAISEGGSETTPPSSSPQALERGGLSLMLGNRFAAVQELSDAAMEQGRVTITEDEGGKARKAESVSALPPRWSSLANPGALPNLNTAPANGTAAYFSGHVWNDGSEDLRYAAATRAGLRFTSAEDLADFLTRCEDGSVDSPYSLATILQEIHEATDLEVLTVKFGGLRVALGNRPTPIETGTAARGPIVAPTTAAARAASPALRVVPGGLGAAH